MKLDHNPGNREGGLRGGNRSILRKRVVMALRQADAATPVAEIFRKLWITEIPFYRWNCRYSEGVEGDQEWRSSATSAPNTTRPNER